MTLALRCCAKLVLALALAGLTLDTTRAGPDPPHKALSKLPLSLESVTGPIAIRLPTSTQWKGHEYDVETGVDVLMGVIRDPAMSAKDRELALLDLSRLRTHLKGRPCLDELRTRFDDAGPLEKKIILTCFMGSRDARAIPLFTRVLDNEKSMKLRLSAASGLAQWNVRRGVAELVNLLESEEILPQPARMSYVRDYALALFRTKNRLKGWGFPNEQIQESIAVLPNLDKDQKRALYIAEIRKWFAENEHRFPDWKPGDPLPEAPKEEPTPEENK